MFRSNKASVEFTGRDHFSDIVFLPQDMPQKAKDIPYEKPEANGATQQTLTRSNNLTQTQQVQPAAAPAGARQVTFRWPESSGQNALLVGDFNQWQGQPMEKGENGFTAKFAIAPNTYRYAFIIDGAWQANKQKPLIQLPDGRECNIMTLNPQ